MSDSGNAVETENETFVLDIQPKDRFKLTDDFVNGYKKTKPKWGPLGEITYRRTYSRIKADDTMEEWFETIRRVVEGCYTYQRWHCRKLGLPWNQKKAQKSAQIMYDLIFNFKFLPPGRGLWMCGTEYVEKRGSAALNNCAFISTEEVNQDFSEPFCFLMDFSMLGVGVGGDCKGTGKMTVKDPRVVDEVYWVDDSREGWVSLLRRYLDAYAGKASMPKEINYDKVRTYGALIKGFGGKASGPEPLKKLMKGISESLDPLIGKPITSTAIVDIFDKIGVCVVAGNVRRSAIIMLGDKQDKEFAELKDPKLHKEEMMSHRWASNNSIFAEVGMNYTAAADSTAKNGEPGFFWLNNARTRGRMVDPETDTDLDVGGCNPCSEQQLVSHELCCLVETFPSLHDTYDEFQRTLKFAYLYAKTITLVPTHDPRTNAVVMRNRRIGTSQSGIVDAFVKHGRTNHLAWCDKGYTYLKELDKQYSDWLCVPRSKRITSVKPGGTVPLLPGVNPGIHYPHAEFYYRTIRLAKNSPLVTALERANYRLEQDVYDDSSMVAYFPIHEKHFDRSKDDVSMWEQLSNAAAIQRFWSDNMVSITVTFNSQEASQIKYALSCFEDQLKSVSFLPVSDHSYEQAPYQKITKEEYEAAIKKLKPIDYSDTGHEKEDKFCDGDKCEIPMLKK